MRPADFVAAHEGRDPPAVDAIALEVALRGEFVRWPMVPVKVTHGDLVGEIYVASDYFSLGAEDDFLRMPLLPETAQRIADANGWTLPTPKIVDAIWRGAGIRMPPMTTTPDAGMVTLRRFAEHNQRIQRALEANYPGMWPGRLIAGHKKDVVLTNELTRGRVAIYGWHRPDGSVIQGLNAHAHSDRYVDYSHGVRFVDGMMRVNGASMSLTSVFASPELAPLVSREGVLLVTKQPSATTNTIPGPPPASTEEREMTLRRGMKGSHVADWQAFLNENGFGDQTGAPLVEDGDFGGKTEFATKLFQAAVKVVPDGVVGPATLEKARFYKKTPTPPPLSDTEPAPPKIPFVQAKHFTRASRTQIDLIVVHDMEYPERPEGAEWCAQFFRDPKGRDKNGNIVPVNASAHFCLTPETRVLCSDFIWRPIGDVAKGDRLIATEEHTPGMSGRTLQQTTITKVKRREAECLRINFNDGRLVVCSLDHRWLVKPPLGGTPWEWRAADTLAKGWRLLAPMRPWETRSDRNAGYLEGIYDGEGCWSSNGDLSFAQKRGVVLDRAHDILIAAGLPYRLADQRDNGVVVTDLSGLQATLQALGQFRPRRLMCEPRWIGRALKSRTYSNYITVVGIERIDVCEVVSIETSTHTFFAEGIVSHNCVDNNSVVQCVLEKDVAHHAPGANHNGIGIEHAGYASQSRAQWLDEYSTAELRVSAKLVADLCSRWSIPIAKLSVEELRAGKRGICGHLDVTNAFNGGEGHQDPGPNFPWTEYLEMVRNS